MPEFFIGIDGGGTKTAFALSEGVRILATARLPRSNPNDIGMDAAGKILADGVEKLCSDSGIEKSRVKAIFAGMSGVTSGGFMAAVRVFLSALLPGAFVGIGHDGVNVIFSAFPDRDGAGVICGTGSSCFVKKGNALHRIGGYGLFDLAGGGYEIGRAAISHALRCADGRDKPGILASLVREKFGLDLVENLAALISSGKAEIASYARLVYKAYAGGDRYAAEIIKAHTAYIAELINTASRFFGGEYEAAIAGGIGTDPVTLDILRPLLGPGVSVFPLTEEPVVGALNAARAGFTLIEKKVDLR